MRNKKTGMLRSISMEKVRTTQKSVFLTHVTIGKNVTFVLSRFLFFFFL